MSTLALDLATVTGWAVESCGIITSGTVSFRGGRYEGGGMRYLRFRKWLREMFELAKPEAVFYEEVRRHLSTDAAHVYGGFLAMLQTECEARDLPYLGIPVGTIKKKATGRGNAKKAAMVAAARERWPDQLVADDNQADALWILECGRAA
jgi:Holliday junction resolvasome RuvABC endonuclease subunit